ncbi:hypothetical protein KBT16_16345 [Nostoc sp. CCCryo 231-06]|nr:hypothetical protein [Nostoc sp. CCCryo 231-06]
MQKTEKKQLRSWSRTGLTGSQSHGLTTPQPTHSLISLTANIGRSWFRHRPPYIPTL